MLVPPHEPLLEVLSSAPLTVNPVCSTGHAGIAEDLFATRNVALSKPAQRVTIFQGTNLTK